MNDGVVKLDVLRQFVNPKEILIIKNVNELLTRQIIYVHVLHFHRHKAMRDKR